MKKILIVILLASPAIVFSSKGTVAGHGGHCAVNVGNKGFTSPCSSEGTVCNDNGTCTVNGNSGTVIKDLKKNPKKETK